MILKLTKGCAIALIALCSAMLCHAGGDSWAFYVVSLDSDLKDEYVLRLKPAKAGTEFPMTCETLQVRGEFESLFWLFKSGPSKAQHEAALKLLSDALKSKSPVHFGWMGSGIKTDSSSGACAAVSRALAVEDAIGGAAVFSYYKWP
jgi:hypothetical protein